MTPLSTKCRQFLGHLTGEAALPGGELNDQIVHRTEFIDRILAHAVAPSFEPLKQCSHVTLPIGIAQVG